MKPLYSVGQSRAIDNDLITGMSDDGYELMQRAGNACYENILRHYYMLNHILVYAGIGNNGGDAYIVARLLHEAGKQVNVVAIADCERLTGNAKRSYSAYIEAGGIVTSHHQAHRITANIIIDGMLGIGLSRPIDENMMTIINDINKRDAVRFSIDVPSGLDSDTGCAMPIAVKADMTVSFICRKQGLYTNDGKTFCGQLLFDDLQTTVYDFDYSPTAELIGYDDCRSMFCRRVENVHKKQFGHILVIGGDYGMAGAVCLAGLSALRAGAGLVTIATRTEHAKYIGIAYPELMTLDATDSSQLKNALEQTDIIVFGAGMIDNEWGRYLFNLVTNCQLVVVADAGALRILTVMQGYFPNWILTPHPGEAGDLLGLSAKKIQRNRFTAINDMCSQYSPNVILKGAGTLVMSNKKQFICEGGNPAMSVAGMGDVLSGILGGLLAQNMTIINAMVAGVCVHNQAGDIVAKDDTKGVLPTDILPIIRQCVNPLNE